MSINGWGNSLDNTIIGNVAANTIGGGSGDDTLSGGAGNDRLIGSTGSDSFVFDTLPDAATNRDVIVDFNHRHDRIVMENAVYTNLGSAGSLNPDFFRLGSAAGDANDHIIYDRKSGALLYDADGAGGAVAVQFATLLDKPVVTAKDFAVL
jgi:serralysin